MKKLMMIAGLMFAVAPLALLAAADRQMVNGGYYFIEGKDPSQQSAERMSINGDGRSYVTPNPGLTEGDEVTFKASPEPGLRTAEWGTLIHANKSTDARNYEKYNKWTVAKTEPTAEDFKAVSKDAQVVQEGEIAVTKESIQAAKAEAVSIADGVVSLGVTVNTNGNFTAETKSWAPVELTSDNVEVKDGKIVISIPVDSQSGFMILQSGDAKVGAGNAD